MKRVFEINRFVNYLRYDLNNLKTNYGLSLMLISILPIIMYVIYLVLHVILGGEWSHWVTTSVIVSAIAACVALLFSLPKNLYGKLTERREGTAWLLIPASTFEKFLSMLLILLVVVPVIFLLIYGASTGILTLIDPVYKDFVSSCNVGFKNFFHQSGLENRGFVMSSLTWLNWSQNIMAMALGAICFKKSKITKTLLCMFAFAVVVVLLCSIFFHTVSISGDELEAFFENMTAKKAQFYVNFILNTIEALMFAALAGGIYWRLRTLKH